MGPHLPALPAAAGSAARGGVLLAYERDGIVFKAFVPAEVALRLTTLGAMTEVPGARPPARGIALADGEVVTVLELGKAPPRVPRGAATRPRKTGRCPARIARCSASSAARRWR